MYKRTRQCCDLLTSEGFQRAFTEPEPIMSFPAEATKYELRGRLDNSHRSDWLSQQLKQINGPCPKRAEELVKLNIRQIRGVIDNIDRGHHNIKEHLTIRHKMWILPKY